jgi:hypothetical protein
LRLLPRRKKGLAFAGVPQSAGKRRSIFLPFALARRFGASQSQDKGGYYILFEHECGIFRKHASDRLTAVRRHVFLLFRILIPGPPIFAASDANSGDPLLPLLLSCESNCLSISA